MKENKLFVSVLSNKNEDEPSKLAACYFCNSAILTVNPEYHWVRQLKIQTLDPFGILRDFIIELHDYEDVTIETC